MAAHAFLASSAAGKCFDNPDAALMLMSLAYISLSRAFEYRVTFASSHNRAADDFMRCMQLLHLCSWVVTAVSHGVACKLTATKPDCKQTALTGADAGIDA